MLFMLQKSQNSHILLIHHLFYLVKLRDRLSFCSNCFVIVIKEWDHHGKISTDLIQPFSNFIFHDLLLGGFERQIDSKKIIICVFKAF